MLAEIKAVRNVNVVLTAGSSGVFDVIHDGVTVFSKSQLGRFPVKGEIGKIFICGDDE